MSFLDPLIGNFTFLHPALLLAGFSLPVLWFLLRLLPPPPQPIHFPALFFLRTIDNDKSVPAHAPWWLLLLRLMMLLALIIGLAGPVINQPKPLQGSGPILFVIDDSWAAASLWAKRRDALLNAAAALRGQTRSIYVLTTAPTTARMRDQQWRGPLTPQELADWAKTAAPKPFAPDYANALTQLTHFEQLLEGDADIQWLSDGVIVSSPDQSVENDLWRFVSALSRLGSLTQWRDKGPIWALMPLANEGENMIIHIRTSAPVGLAQDGAIVITGQNGRILTQQKFTLPAGKKQVGVPLSLPLALRNKMSRIRIAGVRSAGAVQLVDASARRVKIGLVTASANEEGSLLQGATYLTQALLPYANLSVGAAKDLVGQKVGLIILDDIGRLRNNDREALRQFVANGGIVVRFAGPAMADAISDQGGIPLIPGRARSGGRAFGGALTWEAPQKLVRFAPDSPLADLSVPQDVVVRRQILTTPLPDSGFQSWAELEDGTPLITAQPVGDGMVILFHVATTPDWSDLPISGGFVEILRRILTLPDRGLAALDPQASYAPIRVLDGYGDFSAPDATLKPQRFKVLQQSATIDHPPGLYGNPDAPIAVNVVRPNTKIASLETKAISNFVNQRGYEGEPAKNLAAYFYVLALLLFFMDSLLSLWMRGLMPNRFSRAPLGVALLIASSMAVTLGAAGNHAQAQELPPIEAKAMAAALNTRLAYIETTDPEIDAITKAGLATLSNRLQRRTALEPAPPVAIDLERDNLTVYPLLYWVITADTPIPSDFALANLEDFMTNGGLLIIDTRDGDQALATRQTANGEAMRRILTRLNIPPLEPLPKGHVLGRAFYLLPDLPGRNQGGPIWVKAANASPGQNDGVTPIIIGGRDWAGAWALDAGNVPYLPMGNGGLKGRELAFRAGINMIMVALTGSYKIDQLHIDSLLQQLGDEPVDMFQPRGDTP